jgi:hypothetical protein
MLKNIKKRERVLGTITIIIAITALSYNFVVEPLTNRWSGLEKEIRDKEILLTKHNRILRDREEIEKLHSEYTKYFQKEKLTPEEESATALSNLEKLARKAKVRITNIKPLAIRSYENYAKFTFKVTTESRIDELTNFIYSLQTSEQLLKTDRMVLRAKERQHEVIKAILHITKISLF